MAILWADSFDGYADTAGISKRYAVIQNMGTAPSTTEGRFGTKGVRLPNTTISWFGRVLAAGVNQGGACMSRVINTTAAGTLFYFADGGTTHVTIGIDSTQHLNATRNGTLLGTSTSTIPTGVHVHIEAKVKIDDTVGTVEIRANGVSVLSLTGQDTRNGGNASFDRVINQGLGIDYIDDFVIWDTSGSANTDFIGDVRVGALFPTGAGAHTDFTPSTGSNWQNVDDASPNDDTDYNASSTVGHIDSFAMQDLPASAASVLGVVYNLYSRKDDAGLRQLAPLVRISGVDYVGTTVTEGGSYALTPEVTQVSPSTGQPFSVSEVNAMEFGYKVIA